MSETRLRSLRLIEQRRFREAQGYLRDVIRENPEDPEIYYLLACCLSVERSQAGEALAMIDEAIRLAPDRARYHAIRSNILSLLGRPREALRTAEEAKALDPGLIDGYIMSSNAYLLLGMSRQAEAAARAALAIDPQNESAANQLSHALRLQGRKIENVEQIQALLALNPENPRSHATAGWSALQNGQRQVAERHFLEALRLDPEDSFSREGLLESFRARSLPYRGYLRYCFFLERLQPARRWIFVIGLVLLSQLSRAVFTGPWAPLAVAIGIIYLLFVLSVWVARGAGNLFVFCDRTGRHALRRPEKIEALVVGVGVFLGIVLLAAGVLLKRSPLLITGLTLTAGSIPGALIFLSANLRGRIVFACLMAAIYVSGGIALAGLLGPGLTAGETGMASLRTILWLTVLTTWLGSIPYFRRS